MSRRSADKISFNNDEKKMPFLRKYTYTFWGTSSKFRFIALTILLAVSVNSYAQRCSGEVMLYGAQLEGKELEYCISETRAEKLPKWDPTKVQMPLPINDAVSKAQVMLKKRNPKIDSFIPTRIDFGSIGWGKFAGLWYCSIYFDAVVGGQRLGNNSQLSAVLLMDGTIVEPRSPK